MQRRDMELKTKMFGGFFGTVVFGALGLLSEVSYAETTSADATVHVADACTMIAAIDSAHNAIVNPGQYVSEIGQTTLKVVCNDAEGYAIYAIGNANNELGNNKLIANLNGTPNSTYDIATGTATSGSMSNWAMRINAVSGTYAPTIQNSFGSYHDVPTTYTKVAQYNASTDQSTGSAVTSTYAAYVKSDQPAGNYDGKVKYTMVHPMSEVPKVSVKCNPTGATIGTNSSTDIVCMQDITATNKSSILASMTEETQYTLKDKRDGKEYKVAKLADGKVWMTQNLDLDIDSSRTYTNEDTDLGWNTQTNSYQTASWAPSRSTYATTTNNVHEWCQGGGAWNTQYGYCQNNNTPESYDPGDLYWNTTTSNNSDWNAYYNSCNYSTTTPSCDESLNPLSDYVSSTGTQQYHLGNYYNWPAAIASNDASIYGTYNETTGEYENLETHQSICPAGWTLPYANYNYDTDQSEGDFVDLWSEYGWDSNNYSFTDGISTIWSVPLYFAPTGYFNGVLRHAGSDGDFWSSVASVDVNAKNASFDVGGSALPAVSSNRYYGFSIRCLLR